MSTVLPFLLYERNMPVEYRTIYPSPLGELTLASDGTALTGLWIRGQKYFGGGAKLWEMKDDLPVFAAAGRWLDDYFAGEETDPEDLPLAPTGTEFQQTVWQALRDIPYGTTVTYGELAQRIGCGSARAVGTAVGRNPISIIIPCHRVLGADGSLTGYAGGIDCKRWLLDHEKLSRQQ